ncbi:histidine phosphatase family protein [Demequina sp. B12]|uniref:histidine phosphatase family protein n=1 Tax=Demequina sp. B12 TaxID=2992757 RepID=UPI00237A6E1C|nr:histidine phosphatase family protein [Demequina sp. B12]MDE0572912.1 histidine phosphatase family protein [Demequina sp. B12]
MTAQRDTGASVGPEYDDSEKAAPSRSPFAADADDLVSPLTVVLVRHGVTDMTLSHALSGSGEVGPSLNAQGKIQVAKAADAVYSMGRRSWEHLAPASRVFASPMTRTQETGGAIGRRIGAHVETDDRVREIHFGEWEGLTGDEVAQRYGDAIHQWRFAQLAPPGGESIPQVGERMDSFLRDIAAQHAALAADGKDELRTWAVASHAVAIKSAVGVSLGMDASTWGAIWPQPASLTALRLHIANDGQIRERHVLCVGAPTS